jgi:hypothetical protein
VWTRRSHQNFCHPLYITPAISICYYFQRKNHNHFPFSSYSIFHPINFHLHNHYIPSSYSLPLSSDIRFGLLSLKTSPPNYYITVDVNFHRYCFHVALYMSKWCLPTLVGKSDHSHDHDASRDCDKYLRREEKSKMSSRRGSQFVTSIAKKKGQKLLE